MQLISSLESPYAAAKVRCEGRVAAKLRQLANNKSLPADRPGFIIRPRLELAQEACILDLVFES